MANRYDVGSVAKFNPFSYQELAVTPMMQRQKHDQLIAQQEMLRQGLAKVDPLDVHMNEALNVKSGIENKLASQAELLSREGINPNTQGDFLALNREYQNLISPTGRLGQINAAKQVYAKNFNDYLEDAQKTKGWSRERALDNWNTIHKPKYTGFDINKNITNIDPYGAPKYIDIAERVQNYAKEAGMSTQEFANASGALSYDQAGNRYVINSNSKGLTSDNLNQLNQVAQTLNRELSNPNSEVRRSIEFDKQDPNTVMQDVISQLGIYRNNKSSKESGNSVGSVDWYDPKKGSDDDSMDLEAVNVEGVDIAKNSNLLSKLNGTFVSDYKPVDIIASRAGVKQDLNGKVQSQKIQKETLDSAEYRTLARNIARTQNLGSDLKSLKVQDAVKKYLSENEDVTIQNRYVDPNTNKQGMLFASKELTGKDSKEKAGNLILERVQRGAYDMVDEEGNKIDKDELGNFTFTYSGDMTPKSQIGNKFNNPKQNIGARTGVLIDKESGKTKTVYVSRGSDDFNTPQFKAMETINGISKIADVQPGIYHKIKAPLFKEYGLKDVEVKYNKNKNTYNLSYTDNDGTNVDQEFPDEKFQEFILNAHGAIK